MRDKQSIYALSLLVLLLPLGARAHVMLAESQAQAGSTITARFTVTHGCETVSPTVALRIEIPKGVVVIEAPSKPGWTVKLDYVQLPRKVKNGAGHPSRNRISAVTWRGFLEKAQPDAFAIALKLPSQTGPLVFPAIQTCAKLKNEWVQVPAPGQSEKDLHYPAPMLMLTSGPPQAMPMPGMPMPANESRPRPFPHL